jgi:hypothetical protein
MFMTETYLDETQAIQTLFETLVSDNPEDKIQTYFQPPDGTRMIYPCIVFERYQATSFFANNSPYLTKKRYLVTVMDKNPNSEIPNLVAKLPFSFFQRFFATSGLNHDVFNIYF